MYKYKLRAFNSLYLLMENSFAPTPVHVMYNGTEAWCYVGDQEMDCTKDFLFLVEQAKFSVFEMEAAYSCLHAR